VAEEPPTHAHQRVLCKRRPAGCRVWALRCAGRHRSGLPRAAQRSARLLPSPTIPHPDPGAPGAVRACSPSAPASSARSAAVWRPASRRSCSASASSPSSRARAAAPSRTRPSAAFTTPCAPRAPRRRPGPPGCPPCPRAQPSACGHTYLQAHTRGQHTHTCAQLMLTQRPSHAAQRAAAAMFLQCVRGACSPQRRCAAGGPRLDVHRHDLRGGRAGPVQRDLELHAAGALRAGRDQLQPVRRGVVLLRSARRTLRAAAHRSPGRHVPSGKHSLRCGTATGWVASLAARFRRGARSARAAGLGPGWVSARAAPAGRPPGRPGGARRRARPPPRAGRRPRAGRPRWPAGPPASACARPRASWSTTVSPLHLHR